MAEGVLPDSGADGLPVTKKADTYFVDSWMFSFYVSMMVLDTDFYAMYRALPSVRGGIVVLVVHHRKCWA